MFHFGFSYAGFIYLLMLFIPNEIVQTHNLRVTLPVIIYY